MNFRGNFEYEGIEDPNVIGPDAQDLVEAPEKDPALDGFGDNILDPTGAYGIIPDSAEAALPAETEFAPQDDNALFDRREKRPAVDEAKVLFARSFIERELSRQQKTMTLANYAEIFRNISEKLKNNNIAYYEGAEDELGTYMMIEYSILCEKQRDWLEKNPGRRRDVWELNANHARWTEDMKENIKRIKDDPESLSAFWGVYEKVFLASGSANKEIGKMYKNGILGELAVENLFEEVRGRLGPDVSIEVSYPAPEEDAFEQTDLLITVSRGGKQKELRCQVKTLSMASQIRGERPEREAYVKKNIINFGVPDNRHLRYKYPLESKINDFFRKHGKDGIFCIIPASKDTLKENGTTNEETASIFIDRLLAHPLFEENFMP